MPIQVAIQDLLRQIQELLNQLSPEEYRRPLPEFDDNSLGQHFRHILEFFQCLEQGASEGLIDYAARRRNLLYEAQPGITRDAFEVFSTSLRRFQADEKLYVRAELGGAERPSYESTVGRELLFAYDHAIHHLAIIKIGLRTSFQHIQTNPDLGVSPSTIKARLAKED